MFHFSDITNTLQITGCHFGLMPPGWHYPRHHHHLFELLCCLEGEGSVELNRESITLHEGDWLLIKSGVRHQSTTSGVARFGFFNVHFDLDDTEVRRLLAASSYRHIRKSEAEKSRLRFYVDELSSVMKRSPAMTPADENRQPHSEFSDKLLLQSNTLLIIHDVLALLRDQNAREHSVADSSSPAASLFATDAAHAIEEKLLRDLCDVTSVSAVATELNISRSQCSKLFSKVYGLSPRQYVSRHKLKLAKELLVTTNLSMAMIAEQLGFRSASHFSRQFRRWTGQSPSEFKPKHKPERT